MRTENFQQKMDNLIYLVFGKIIPKIIKPNHLTLLRFILIPIVFTLLYSGQVVWGLIFFIIAASTDFLDGTLARRRNQITDLGKVIDPIADKLLIGTMLYFIGFEYLIVKIFLLIIALEIIAALTSGFAYRIIGRPVGANVYGKIKMVIQSFAVGIFILGIVIKAELMINISIGLLFIALIFALLSAIEQGRKRLKKIISRQK